MKIIPLTNGGEAIVDDDDYPYLSRFNWTRGATGHAVRQIKNEGFVHSILLETMIMQRDRLTRLIFKNRNPLDCRKENLELVSWASATISSKKMKGRDTTSKYKGVCYDKRRKLWTAYLTKRNPITGVREKLLWEFFKTEEEAAARRRAKVIELFPEAYRDDV